MIFLLGYGIVIASIFGGYALAGGHLAALYQPLELLMIFGGGLGGFVVANDSKAIKATIAAVSTCIKPSKASKTLYLDLLALLFEILTKIRKDGMMAIENDVENPEASLIFKKYPDILKDHHIMDFLCDYFRLMVSGNMDPYQLENLMENDIDTHHMEGNVPVSCVARLGDALPAFGIIAAVMGIVHVMENVALPPAELGVLIAHALVGTFLGILLSYGFVTPISSLLSLKLEDQTKILQTIKVTIMASLNGYPPAIAVEFGRKVLYSTERPGFMELEAHVKQTKVK
jgi:chemotaxis protein MotA